ncbi:DUF262 domain-containing HNH endonuclease family protein [Nitrosomonas sp. sh817]|uniref:DUF262 domain-containing protein n=1 Tax=Nitrosomonas sp. sh817 TaxID=3070658 RepID=UPI0027DD67EB|nr:DUF262 domain-containing HNH endonuclease family protein [Nitrosomonas sp. sh817]WMJ07515.1 DUF262 domain-containing HNH endonuclease family protein [Nitrosomonas sp. sh817]
MSATNFKTENNTYRKLIGNGLTYRIPRFQRDYSWTEDEWEDLWLDILGTIQTGGEPAHYMGYLVLQSQDDKNFDVIDGQQRLTTLTLIVLAILKNLKRLVDEKNNPEHNQQRIEQIRQTYIGYLDPVTLVSRSKLTLNRNNDHYFQTYLVPLGHLPQRGFRASEHGLRKAFEWFDKRVREHGKKAGGDEGVALASLVETMSDRLFFTVISVTDELNAYKVFETLNARGVRLSSTDLLKNYLFSVLHRDGERAHEMKALEDRWEAMISRLGSESFPDFLRVHWISRKTSVRQSELFKTIRAQIIDRESVFELLRGMEEDMDTYLALTNPEVSLWAPNLKGFVQNLRMFSVRQPFSLLLAAHRRFSSEDFESLLRSCVMISFRYNVIGSLPTHEQEHVYHSVAQKISNGGLTTAPETLDVMKPIYPNDDKFRGDFSEKILRTTNSRNSRIVRYILCALESQLNGQDYDFESDSITIEHILPQNPASGWSAFNEEEADAMVYRLGNMTLLAKGQNRDLGNAEFTIKKPVLAASNFELTRKVADENLEWTPERIAARQKSMAKIATSVWRIAQLS